MADADRDRIARSLRDLRAASGLSTNALAAALGWSQSKVSKIERGETRADPADVLAWAEATGATPGAAEALAADAEGALDQARSWQVVHARGLAEHQRQVGDINQAMTGLRGFVPYAVPGLLQTPLYAKRILELADITGQRDIDAAVAARMNRQHLLYDESRTFRWVITEGALRMTVGPPGLMRGQAAKIIDTMALPNVTVYVLPLAFGPAELAYSGFVIYDIPGEPMVLVELLTDRQEIRTAWKVAAYEAAFDHLVASAVTGPAAEALIRDAMSPAS